MTKQEARLAIAERYGAERLQSYETVHDVVRFPVGRLADECKAVLDTFDPGFTGEVFADNRLLIADPTPAQPKEVTQ